MVLMRIQLVRLAGVPVGKSSTASDIPLWKLPACPCRYLKMWSYLQDMLRDAVPLLTFTNCADPLSLTPVLIVVFAVGGAVQVSQDVELSARSAA